VKPRARPPHRRWEGVGSDYPRPVQAPAAVHVMLSALAGAAAAFISLEDYFFGIPLAAAACVLLFRHARRNRWFALGGFLVGMGVCAAVFLSAALTNHDPAVTYDSSTIGSFWVAVFLALCGGVTLVAATTTGKEGPPA
jgi:drug/metabolite transporter (DMT)-like permease